jgi:hypothetical protein
MVTITVTITIMASIVTVPLIMVVTIKAIRTFAMVVVVIASSLFTMLFTEVTTTVVTSAARVSFVFMSLVIVDARARIIDQYRHCEQSDGLGMPCTAKGTGIEQCAQLLKDLRHGVRISVKCKLFLERRHQVPICDWEHLG